LFKIPEAGFFGHNLLGAVFDGEAEKPEQQCGDHAADGGIEHGILQIFARNKAHQEGENEAGEASDEREILHVGRWIRKISLSVAVFAPKTKILKWEGYFVKNSSEITEINGFLCIFWIWAEKSADRNQAAAGIRSAGGGTMMPVF
jgi:hypothetical protein